MLRQEFELLDVSKGRACLRGARSSTSDFPVGAASDVRRAAPVAQPRVARHQLRVFNPLSSHSYSLGAPFEALVRLVARAVFLAQPGSRGALLTLVYRLA